MGYILTGFGMLLLLLNGMAAPMDHPDTNRRAALIALFLIVFGLVVQGFLGF